MKTYREILLHRITEDAYPEEAQKAVLAAYDQLQSVPTAYRVFENVIFMYENNLEMYFKNTVKRAKEASDLAGVDPRMGVLITLLAMTEILHGRYRERGYSEEMFLGAVRDLKWKLQECKDWEGVWGVLPFEWFDRFFDLSRHVLGRLQFEMIFSPMEYSAGGFTLRKCDPVVNMHIPSSGPLTPESCMDAFRQAEAFYAPYFKDGVVPFMCSSWLLAPYHRAILPEKSNVRRFGALFDVVKFTPDENYGTLIRIFNQRYSGSFSHLPEDTSMRRIYKKYLIGGGQTGSALGFFFMKHGEIVKG